MRTTGKLFSCCCRKGAEYTNFFISSIYMQANHFFWNLLSFFFCNVQPRFLQYLDALLEYSSSVCWIWSNTLWAHGVQCAFDARRNAFNVLIGGVRKPLGICPTKWSSIQMVVFWSAAPLLLTHLSPPYNTHLYHFTPSVSPTTHLTQLISHNPYHTSYPTQLISHTTYLTQLILQNPCHTIHPTQLISIHFSQLISRTSFHRGVSWQAQWPRLLLAWQAQYRKPPEGAAARIGAGVAAAICLLSLSHLIISSLSHYPIIISSSHHHLIIISSHHHLIISSSHHLIISSSHHLIISSSHHLIAQYPKPLEGVAARGVAAGHRSLSVWQAQYKELAEGATARIGTALAVAQGVCDRSVLPQLYWHLERRYLCDRSVSSQFFFSVCRGSVSAQDLYCLI